LLRVLYCNVGQGNARDLHHLSGQSVAGVYANSTASLAVIPNDPGLNFFTILTQYIVGAGASNHAVKVGARIVVSAPIVAAASSVTHDAALGDMWDANYATWPPNEGPSLNLSGTKSPSETIAIRSNAFNKVVNENNDWFSNMSFGIQSESGFIGMTWSPNPQEIRAVTPRLHFYLVSGNYGSNVVASFDDVSNTSASIKVPSDFIHNKCTVTHTEIGDWLVTPGEPS